MNSGVPQTYIERCEAFPCIMSLNMDRSLS